MSYSDLWCSIFSNIPTLLLPQVCQVTIIHHVILICTRQLLIPHNFRHTYSEPCCLLLILPQHLHTLPSSRAMVVGSRHDLPSQGAPFNSPGDSPRPRAEPQSRGWHLPQAALRRGAEGRQARRPGTLIFFRPRVWMPTPASIKLGYIKQTNRRHLPIITPDTSPDKRPLPRPPLTARTIAATKAFSACADDINLML